MKSISNFPSAFQYFVQEEARQEAQNTVTDKDPSRSSFTLKSLTDFSYSDQLQKFQNTNPILLASIVGTLSKTKGANYEDISRKGFGGPNRSENVDLIPSVVQTISRVLKNRHPLSVSLLPCMNSLNLWANHVPGHLFHFYNAIGDSYRYNITQLRVGPIWVHPIFWTPIYLDHISATNIDISYLVDIRPITDILANIYSDIQDSNRYR